MKTPLIILLIIVGGYALIGLIYWVRCLVIIKKEEDKLPENKEEHYNLFIKIIGSIVLLILWVIGWPIIDYIAKKKR